MSHPINNLAANRRPSNATIHFLRLICTSNSVKTIGLAAISLLLATAVQAAPYDFPGPPSVAAPGDELPIPGSVIGKELSHFMDRDMNGAANTAQIISWDGVGGVVDGIDFTSILPAVSGEIDAIANNRDILHAALKNDTTFLMFSHGNGLSPVGSGTLTTTEGEAIGRAGDISYEFPGSQSKGIWATGSMIDSMNPPIDIDGLELWGPEPPGSDVSRFSLEQDSDTGISVWAHTGLPYVEHATIVTAVTSLLGDLPTRLDATMIDVDALMSYGPDDDFGPGDSITFSIRQIADNADTDGFYATGSELFTLDAFESGVVAGFLNHGGHDWDHAYSLGAMADSVTGRQFDINAIEAASVPEPTTLALTPFAALFFFGQVRRRSTSQRKRTCLTGS